MFIKGCNLLRNEKQKQKRNENGNEIVDQEII